MEGVYQNGRRVKEPNEPMFTLTVVDRHGIQRMIRKHKQELGIRDEHDMTMA